MARLPSYAGLARCGSEHGPVILRWRPNSQISPGSQASACPLLLDAAVVEALPMWLAPNLITLTGMLFVIAAYVLSILNLPEFQGRRRASTSAVLVGRRRATGRRFSPRYGGAVRAWVRGAARAGCGTAVQVVLCVSVLQGTPCQDHFTSFSQQQSSST